jgi:hypothetical protein
MGLRVAPEQTTAAIHSPQALSQGGATQFFSLEPACHGAVSPPLPAVRFTAAAGFFIRRECFGVHGQQNERSTLERHALRFSATAFFARPIQLFSAMGRFLVQESIKGDCVSANFRRL